MRKMWKKTSKYLIWRYCEEGGKELKSDESDWMVKANKTKYRNEGTDRKGL